MDGVSVEYFILSKKCDFFLNKGTFNLASSVQELPVIFKWNDLQSLGKALVDS